MQAILTNVTPYAPISLIQEAGYPDHVSADNAFYKNAVLLYDFQCEKSQLHLLQGTLLVGTHTISHFSDKDYRFWLLNAVRIATRMGIHRCNDIESELDPNFHKLLKRIWWTIYVCISQLDLKAMSDKTQNRDVLCTISGIENARRVYPEDCDTAMLTEDDWPEEMDQPSHTLGKLLSPVSRVEKLTFIQTSTLALIGKFDNSGGKLF